MNNATILWVGNSAESLSTVHRLIPQIGLRCTVVTARDLKEGIALAGKLPLDGVMVDAVVPGEDYKGLVKRLLESSPKKSVPVILVTEKDSGIDLGMLGMKTKEVVLVQRPFNQAELAASLRRMLEKGRKDDPLTMTATTLTEEDQLEAVRRLARVVSHDLNNVLQVILGYSNLLRMRMEPGSFEHDTLTAIEAAAERATKVANQLLAFSRKGRRKNDEVDMHSAIQAAVDSLNDIMPENVVIEEEFLADQPTVSGDPEQLQQAIRVVVENAIEAMSDSGTLNLHTDWAKRAATAATATKLPPHKKMLVVQVTDTGCGISPEVCGQIFEPYVGMKRGSKGKGMGLAILYGIVKNHDGWVDVKTKPDKGTTVTIYLPAAESAK